MKSLSLLMIMLVVFGGFAPFATAQLTNPSAAGFTGRSYGSATNTYQSSRPAFDNFYKGSFDTYWPILNNLEKDQCDSVNSDFIIGIPPGGCSPMVVRSDLLAEQNVPVFCQLSAIRVNPLIDVSTIKSISFKGNYPDEVAGISFHPARAAVKSYRTLLGDPIEENIGYVVIVLKRQPDERNLEEYVSGMLTATIKYDAKGAFGTGAAEYYLDVKGDDDWEKDASESSFWAGKGYLRVKNVDEGEATIEVLTDKDNVYRTVTLKEGATSNRIYLPGQYCTAAMKLRLNKIDNSEDMAKINIDGDTFWVRKGSKLLGGKCVVRDLNVFPGGSGTIEISCSGNNRFTLVLGDSGVVLNNGTGDKDNINVGIGGSIKGKIDGKSKDIYLGYYGKNDAFGDKTDPSGKFVILFDGQLNEDEVSALTSIIETNEFAISTDMLNTLKTSKIFRKKYDARVLFLGAKDWGITLKSVGIDKSEGGYSEDTYIPKYLSSAESTVLELVDEYPSEKKENGEYFGEEALYNQIELAGRASDDGMRISLIKKFLSEYPSSKSVEYMRDLKLSLERFDHAGASTNVFVNNNDYNIRVDGFALGSGASDSVTVKIGGGASHTIKRDRTYDIINNFNELNLTAQKTVLPRLTVNDIDGSSAEFTYYWKNEKGGTSHESAVIAKGLSANLGDRQFSVTDTKVREVAYVSLIPEVRNTKTEANFTFNIGIEKRAFELSPEKAKEKIKILNKSIADWEDKIEKLGKLVKGMKAACLVTSTVLTLKSFISGFSGGTAIARGKVMNIYEAKCRKEKSEMSQEECFAFFSADIERDVAAYGAAITGVNDKVKGCTTGSEGVRSGFLESKVVDSKKYVGSLKDCATAVKSDWKYVVDKKTTLNKSDLRDAKDYQAVMTYEDSCSDEEKGKIASARGDSKKVGELQLSVSCQIAKNELDRALNDNIDRLRVLESNKKADDALGIKLDFTRNKVGRTSHAKVATKGFGSIKKDSKVAAVQYGGKDYYVVVGETGSAESVYDDKGAVVKNIVETEASSVTMNKAYEFVLPADSKDSCSNRMGKAYVRYYEKANKQGFAAVVPIDKANGWYAYIRNEDYSASGIPNAFEICNVGRDGEMGEGSKSGDICQYFQSSVSSREFISCRFDATSLYKKAERQIQAANRNGNGVDLDGEFAYKTSPLGPASTGMECTDFMSVSDCNLMFNVCDPVICPTSRCDLGGAFPVSDVIASGIIGSVALCLPNFGVPSKGGVLIPVCLSGIHAGLDSYVSILKSHKQCLEENVESGVYTGICDEITAVYTCEFFWGQFAPILDTLLVRVVSGLTGGAQTKGGAEYLTTQAAFDNLDKSIDYFSNNYMRNSLRAFNVRNTEEIGSAVCKGFIGSSVPTSADMLDSLLEPESPSQFYAYFSEEVFSDATVPSTSHYKVYYHIYAGNDEGAQYRVYLKNPPVSSYYASRQTLTVKSGFAARGIAADEAIDFTAPTGYKELCVSINGRDECGFGSVTSDFGLNYASQEYIADQVDDRDISSTEDCVTTSTSAWGLVNPNLQAGAKKLIDIPGVAQTDIATTGIIRVCASINPNKGVVGGNDVYCKVKDNKEEGNFKCNKGYICEGEGVGVCKDSNGNQVSQGNWVDVGSCDAANMRCWLDTRSVKENLGQYMAVNNLTVSQLVRDSEDLRELDEQYKNVREKLGVLRKGINGLKGKKVDELISNGIELDVVKEIIKGLDEIAGVGDEHTGQGTNAAKAEALAMKASIYGIIVDALIGDGAVRFVGTREVEDAEIETETGGAGTGVWRLVARQLKYNDVAKYFIRDDQIKKFSDDSLGGETVGTVNPGTGKIVILSQFKSEKIEDTTLGDLENYFYEEGDDVILKRIVVNGEAVAKDFSRIKSNSATHRNKCIGIFNSKSSDESTVLLEDCGDNNPNNQLWEIKDSKIVSALDGNKCLDVDISQSHIPNGVFRIYTCGSSAGGDQSWTVSGKTIRGNNKCITASSTGGSKNLMLLGCQEGNKLQEWIMASSSGAVQSSSVTEKVEMLSASIFYDDDDDLEFIDVKVAEIVYTISADNKIVVSLKSVGDVPSFSGDGKSYSDDEITEFILGHYESIYDDLIYETSENVIGIRSLRDDIQIIGSEIKLTYGEDTVYKNQLTIVADSTINLGLRNKNGKIYSFEGGALHDDLKEGITESLKQN